MGDIKSESDEEIDPIVDIIDYLVRCMKISFKNSHVNKDDVKTKENSEYALKMFKESPVNFLKQFGKYLAPQHLSYFESITAGNMALQVCVNQLKLYHSEETRHKRIRNRRYKALQKLQQETDYFSEKEMMYRNPLLYEQLVGQYLTDEEIKERDGADRENLTLLNLILETVDHNDMRQKKIEDIQNEEDSAGSESESNTPHDECTQNVKRNQWGDFDTPDPKPSFKPEARKQAMIAAPERRLLKEEFVQEMYNSFLNGHDIEVDYRDIDNDEQYDDLDQLNQDAEDKYFDSETTEVENLEEHMKLVDVYGKKNVNEKNDKEDSLDSYMEHLNKRIIS